MKKLSIIVTAVLLVAALLVSCATGSGKKVTVSWYDGSKLLREDSVAEGSKIKSWTPEKDGATFMAWYAEASKTQLYDFDQPVTESAYRAAQEALDGGDPSSGAIYYFNPATATSAWIWSRPLRASRRMRTSA